MKTLNLLNNYPPLFISKKWRENIKVEISLSELFFSFMFETLNKTSMFDSLNKRLLYYLKRTQKAVKKKVTSSIGLGLIQRIRNTADIF